MATTLLRLAAPTTAVMAAQTAVAVAETYYISRLGTAAQAGAALVLPFLMLMMTMAGGGLGSGVASAMARAIGANDPDRAGAILFHSVVVALIAGAVFTLGGLVGPLIFAGLSPDAAVVDLAAQYAGAIFATSIPFWIFNLLSAALRGMGDVKTPTRVSLWGSGFLLVASPAAIFGWGPMPSLGVLGAGLAVAVLNIASMIVMIGLLRRRTAGVRLTRRPLEGAMFGAILRIGVPGAFNALQSSAVGILATAVSAALGVHALAAYGIAARLEAALIPVVFGLASAVLTMVGVQIGAGDAARARRVAWTGCAIGVGGVGTFGLATALAPHLWLNLFTEDPAVLRSGAAYLRIVAPAYGLMSVAFILGFAAQGAGRSLWPSLAVSTRLLIVATGSWALLHLGWRSVDALAILIVMGLAAYAVPSLVGMTRPPFRTGRSLRV